MDKDVEQDNVAIVVRPGGEHFAVQVDIADVIAIDHIVGDTPQGLKPRGFMLAHVHGLLSGCSVATTKKP